MRAESHRRLVESTSTKSPISCRHARWVSRSAGFLHALCLLVHDSPVLVLVKRLLVARGWHLTFLVEVCRSCPRGTTGNSLAEPCFHTISPDRIHSLQPNGPLSGNETFCAQIEVVASWTGAPLPRLFSSACQHLVHWGSPVTEVFPATPLLKAPKHHVLQYPVGLPEAVLYVLSLPELFWSQSRGNVVMAARVPHFIFTHSAPCGSPVTRLPLPPTPLPNWYVAGPWYATSALKLVQVPVLHRRRECPAPLLLLPCP